MPIVLNGTTGITTPTYNGNTTAEYLVPVTAFKNRIINGAMVIDQRNNGASINSTANSTVRPVDRFFVDNFGSGTVACVRSSTAPVGFSNSLSLTVSATDTPAAGDYLLLSQQIEGFNTADLNWGTSNAQSITLSFWIRSSITGTYGAGIRGGSSFQSYPFSYTISAANTWEYKTVTIPGPTSGTFDTTNGTSFQVMFDLGSGTNFSGTANTWQSGSFWRVSGSTAWVSNSGATLFITGVQIESGSTATSFDYRPYGTELALCQRYCQTIVNGGETSGIGFVNGTSANFYMFNYGSVPLRTTPTISYTGTIFTSNYASNISTITGVVVITMAANSTGTRTVFSLSSTPSAQACALNPGSSLVLLLSEL